MTTATATATADTVARLPSTTTPACDLEAERAEQGFYLVRKSKRWAERGGERCKRCRRLVPIEDLQENIDRERCGYCEAMLTEP